jgi:hypothetical protein
MCAGTGRGIRRLSAISFPIHLRLASTVSGGGTTLFNLQDLTLRGSEWAGPGAGPLRADTDLPRLTHLSLYTKLSDAFPTGLRLPALTHLHVAATDRVARSLAVALKRGAFPQLQSMAFQESDLGADVLISLLHALPRSLQVLDLERTRVRVAVGRALAEMVPELPRLELLNLADTQLHPPAADGISKRLPGAAKLKLVPNDTLLPALLKRIRDRLGERFIE